MAKCDKTEKNVSTIWKHITSVFNQFNIDEYLVKNLLSISDEGANVKVFLLLNC